jgi:hypothetical protein
MAGLGGGRSGQMAASAVVTQRFNEAADANEELSELGEAYGHCPKCRSTTFTQRRMWRESKAAFRGEDEIG